MASFKIFDTTVYANKSVPVAADLLPLGDSAATTGGVDDNKTCLLSSIYQGVGLVGTTNLRLGLGAGAAITGTNVTAIGVSAGAAIVGNSDLTAVGYQAAKLATVTCTAVGSGALAGVTTGTENTAVGYQAGGKSDMGAATRNTCLGSQAGLGINGSGNRNICIGAGAGDTNLNGSDNIAIGFKAMSNAVGAGTNIAVGNNVFTATGGADCVAVGYNSCNSGSFNSSRVTALGKGTGSALTSGSDNTLIGYQAGVATLTTGTFNTLLGSGTVVSAAGATYQTAIGAGATCTADNQVMLGRSNETVVHPGPTTISGTVTFSVAQTLAMPAATAAALVITDGTTTLLGFDTRIGTSGVNALAIQPPAALSFAGAAGNAYTLASIPAFTLTQTGTTTVTALAGLSMLIGSPTVTNTSAGLTVTTASAVQINGPLPAGNATFTNSFALDIPTFVTNGTVAAALRTTAPSGASTNFSAILGGANGSVVGIGGATTSYAGLTINTTNAQLWVTDATGNLASNCGVKSTLFWAQSGSFSSNTGAAARLNGTQNAGQLELTSGGFPSWSNSTTDCTTTKDTSFYRVAAKVLGVGTGAGSGTGWIADLAGALTLTANFTDATGTLASTNFAFPVISGRTYKIEGLIRGNNTTGTEGFKMDFNGGTAPTVTQFFVNLESLGVGTVVLGTSSATALNTALTATTFTNGDLRLTGTFTPSSTATLTVQMAENTSAAGTLTVLAGSWITLTDLRAV